MNICLLLKNGGTYACSMGELHLLLIMPCQSWERVKQETNATDWTDLRYGVAGRGGEFESSHARPGPAPQAGLRPPQSEPLQTNEGYSITGCKPTQHSLAGWGYNSPLTRPSFMSALRERDVHCLQKPCMNSTSSFLTHSISYGYLHQPSPHSRPLKSGELQELPRPAQLAGRRAVSDCRQPAELAGDQSCLAALPTT